MGEVRRSGGNRGQAVPLVALVLLVATVVTWMLVGVATRAVDEARAQVAADAAALAGALDLVAARVVAHANAATVVTLTSGPGTTEIEVRRGRGRARARAVADPAPVRWPDPEVWEGVGPTSVPLAVVPATPHP